MEGVALEYHWTLTGTNTGPGGAGHAVRISGFEDVDDGRERAHRRGRWGTSTRPSTSGKLEQGIVETPRP